MFCCLRTCLNGNLRKPMAANRGRDPDIFLDETVRGADVILLSKQMRITGSGGALATAPLVQSKSYFEVKIQQSGCWSIGLATRQTDLTKKFGGGDKESWCLCSDNATRHNDEAFRPVVVTTEEPKAHVNGIKANGNVPAAAAAAGLVSIEDVPEDNLLTTGLTESSSRDSPIKEQTALESTIQPQHVFPDEGDIVGVSFDHIELNFYFNGKNLEVPIRNVKGAVYPVLYVGNGAILDIILDNFHYGPPSGFNKIMLEQSLL